MSSPRQRLVHRWMVPCLLGQWLLSSATAAAAPALPVPCATGACGSNGPSKFITAGAATAVATPNSLTVQQTSNSAILNWSSFNIGANGTVTYKQPSANAIALNRIFQNSPSQIFGNLNANGQVYLLNANGFLFGSTSKVNVGSLVVSSLPLSLTDANFGNGILSPLQNGAHAVFDVNSDPLVPGGRSSVVDADGKPVLDADGNPIPVQVVVQKGAQLTAADQGRILLAGQNVTNGGSLTAPDGQVILAAGTQVYLQADSDPGLRGLVVEVDGTKATAADGTPTTNTAWNQLSGMLSAPRGDVWMVGLAVNQDGRVSATTSVSANGSIHLEAAGSPGFQGAVGNTTVNSTQGGALTIGAQSEMQILPDASSGTAVAAQTQLPSSITLLGEQVVLQGGSITAPGATLTAIAAANPSAAAVVPTNAATPYTVTGVTGNLDPNARLRIDAGTAIDLSGSTASLPATANLVEAQLRSSELADDPTQRDGALHGLTVYVDARSPPPSQLANVSGEIAGVAQTIAQRTEAGGHATLQSEGDAVFASGASLNVSGGSASYAAGVLQTTYLVGANGQLYPIATANPLLTYVGVVNPTFTQTFNTWGVQDVVPTPGLSSYQPAYVQGAAGGSVQFAAPTLVLQGTLTGGAVNGIYQRTPTTAVPGATLTIGVPGGVATLSGTALDYLGPSVRLTSTPTAIVVADDAPLPGPMTLDLPVSYLTSSGFSSTDIFSNYGVTLPANTPLSLPAGSNFAVAAARVDILSSITDPGGTLQFQNVINVGSTTASALRPGVYVGDDVALDVRGLWTNDTLAAGNDSAATSSTWQNGGAVTLAVASTGALLSVGDDVALHASGGAWLQTNGATVAGAGGAINLNAAGLSDGFDVGKNLSIDAFGVNGAAGGRFSLAAPRVEIGPATTSGVWTPAQSVDDAPTLSGVPAGGVFQIYSNLFSDYGFQTIALTANGLVPGGAATSNVFSVGAGTAVDATVRSMMLAANDAMLPSAPTLAGVAAVTRLPPYLQPAESIAFNALPIPAGFNTAPAGATAVGDVTVGTGASITTAAGGAIKITGLDSIVVDGTLRAPGGSVSLEVLSPVGAYIDYEAGFLPGQRIEVGTNGVIDVSGTWVPQPSATGLSMGALSGGGTVNLFADRGAVVADAGSIISIAGASAALDVLQPNGAYGHEIASSAGGALSVRSGEAISLLGDIQAKAGAGGTSGTAAAGSLDVTLSRLESWWSVGTPAAFATFNQNPMVVEIEPTVPSTVPASLANSNQALLGAAQLSRSGLDALQVESGNTVELSSAFTLDLARQIIIDAPVVAANIGANATLSAPYLQVSNQLSGGATTPPNVNFPSSGTGTLNFAGNEIDLLGNIVFQGTAKVGFSSAGDLLLRGEAASTAATSLTGGLLLEGDLTLDAARIYPTTETSFAINAVEDSSTGVPGTVNIGQVGANPGTPLSAGGNLSISAYSVASTGTLYAPFGTISLNAIHALTLGDGSLTSVSGEGLTIPFGATQLGGQQWAYAFVNGIPQEIAGVPARAVNLTAPDVSIAKQATINLSGGGDLSAYEWVPGPGGSIDALAPAAAPGVSSTAANGIAGLYAILPSTRGQAAPQDTQNNDSAILAGESVYLSGAGLAAGSYPLLPARYGLLPGAYLIQIEPGFQSTVPGVLGALADGTPVIAGYLSFGSTGLHQTPGYTGFALYPGSYGNTLASYTNSLASAFFSAAATAAGTPRPTLPADAGSLSIAVTQSLDAQGQVLTTAAKGGLAAPIQISASDLFIGSGADSAPPGAVSISGAVLDSWQPGSLLLGGTMTTGSTASTGGGAPALASSSIDVLADKVTLGAGATLTAGEVILVANQSIEVQSGATLQSSSASSGTALAALPAQQLVNLSNSAAGFLAVSDLNWLIPERTVASTIGAATVSVDAGSTVASRGSLTIDGPGRIALGGTLTGPGAEWSLGSSSIALGTSSNAGASVGAAGGTLGSVSDTLSLDAGMLATLGSAGAVRLASTGAMDLLAPVTLGVSSSGAPSLAALTLQAASLDNVGSDGAAAATQSQFGATTLTLQGAGAPVAAMAGPAGATLSFVANELDVGPNAMAINGFAATHANVSGAVIGQGSGALNVGGDLVIAAGGVTAANAANTTLNATGALTVAPGGSQKLPQLLGGALTLSGNRIEIAGNVAALAGSVTLASATDLVVDSGASISAAGAVIGIGNQSTAAPAGSITATAGGSLNLSSGATLNVAGATSGLGTGATNGSAANGTGAGTGTGAGAGGGSLGSSAGMISLTAGQSASVGATLEGKGGANAAGGSFSLDAGLLAAPAGSSANPITSLANALGAAATSGNAAAGGFTNAIDLRLRSGDVTLSGGSTLSANTVTLTADTGKVLIDGQISAPSGALRGNLSIFGGAGVELASGGSLHADGAGSTGLGGSIEIGAGQLVAGPTGLLDGYNNASIALDPGSTITAAGSAGEGSLLLRAPALLASSDVAITSMSSSMHVGQIVVEPVLVFNTGGSVFSSATNPSVTDFLTVGSTVGNYMNTAAANISGRLAPSGGKPLTVEAGVELVAPGALTLPAEGLDLSSSGLNWQFNGAPVDLTIRAAGGIEVAGTVSDGFLVQQVGDDGFGALQPTLLPGRSASIRLIAGADLASANPLAVASSGSGVTPADLTLDPGVVVRTGTGDIDFVSAGNIKLSAGSGAYTAGTPAIATGGDASTPYPGVSPDQGTTAPNVDVNGNPVNYGVFVQGTALLMSYPAAGGNLTVRAGGDIDAGAGGDGAAPSSPGGVTGWQLRESQSSDSTATWGVNLAAYNWNFGTLGGGDLRIAAGGSANNVSAAAADSLLPQAAGSSAQYVRGGGLSFTAGKDIGSAQVFLADGTGSVTAGGALTATTNWGAADIADVGSVFYLQASSLDVNARLGAVIDGVFNPTALIQPKPTGSQSLPRQLGGSFYSYGDESALSLQSVAGDIVLGSSSDALTTILGAATVQANANSGTLSTFPASLLLSALGGNIVFAPAIGSPVLYPSASGQIDLLAAQNIVGNGSTGGGRIIMSDAAPGSIGTVTTLGTTFLDATFTGDIHSLDSQPALVTAGGSIEDMSLVIPKATLLIAGQDIVDLTYLGQNLSPSDETLISAGRDFSNADGGAVSVGGPGRLDLLAGRNISLGLSQGVITTGNLLNANLPTSQGADITMFTGLGTSLDLSTFLSQIIDSSSAYQGQLVSYVESIQGSTNLSFSAAQTAFKGFSADQQRPLIDAVYFNELSQSGLAESTVPGAGFTQGYRAIDALFPGSRTGTADAVAGAYAGDLTLQFSRIYTLSGGNITLVVPGGGIDVGLANPPATVANRSPSTLGIVAEGTGDVDIYAKGDVNVNSSRIFTLGGGNILIWSNEGSIDAGLGAKTSVSAPPPTTLIGSDGTVTIDFSGAATGSGIRTIQTEPTTPPGNVNLIAPVGTVDAGDAGIGAAGNINIAAQSVIGVTNINFGGTATGVPATVSGINASLSSASSAASGATTAATNSVASDAAQKEAVTPLAQNALSWLDVFVTGLGEENCKPDDVECLKRQRTATP